MVSVLLWMEAACPSHPYMYRPTGIFGMVVAALAFYDGTAVMCIESYGRVRNAWRGEGGAAGRHDARQLPCPAHLARAAFMQLLSPTPPPPHPNHLCCCCCCRTSCLCSPSTGATCVPRAGAWAQWPPTRTYYARTARGRLTTTRSEPATRQAEGLRLPSPRWPVAAGSPHGSSHGSSHAV